MHTDAVHGGTADAHSPWLRIRMMREEAIRGSEYIVGNLERAGLDVDGDDPTLVLILHERAYVTLVDLLTAAGELLLAIARTSASHHALPAHLVC
jgi:hypothetical protein